jgi:HPr kinase/phosphorylase
MPDPVLAMHATAVALGHRAALLRGRPGSGKSDLALRFLAETANAGQFPALQLPRSLVADDQVQLTRVGDRLIVRAPDTIKGKLEVRGLGIIKRPAIDAATVCLLVDLVAPSGVPRLPDERFETVLGVQIPVLALNPFEASAPLKLALALSRMG